MEDNNSQAQAPIQPDTAAKQKNWFLGVIPLVAIVGFVAIIFGALFYFYPVTIPGQKANEHLIAGVPYWGSFRGTPINTNGAFIVYSILHYWGDDRFSVKEISDKFSLSPTDDPNATFSGIDLYKDIADFFTTNGYDARIVEAPQLETIKSFIDKDIPVIVSERLVSEKELPPNIKLVGTTRLVIGYSDKEKKVITHDNIFGNNYELSYEEFDALRSGMTAKVIIVEPKEEILGALKGVNRSILYPKRLAIMDSPGIRRMHIKWNAIYSLYLEPSLTTEERLKWTAELLEEIVFDTAFNELHPASRVVMSQFLARVYVNRHIEYYNDAIKLLEKVTFPLLSPEILKKPYGEWERPNPEMYDDPGWYSSSWITYGYAHFKLGNRAKAGEAFRKAVSLEPATENYIRNVIGYDFK